MSTDYTGTSYKITYRSRGATFSRTFPTRRLADAAAAPIIAAGTPVVIAPVERQTRK